MSETPDTTSPGLGALGAALAAFQAEMPTVPKSHTATVKSDKGSYSYTYAGLADVSEAAMPLLAKHGLSFICLPESGFLTGMLLHESGQSLTASLPINGSTPQQVGSSLTYMRRYLLGCMTGLVTDDDDDGRQAQAAPKQRKATPVRRPEVSSEPPPREQPSAPEGNGISPPQLGKIGALMGEIGIKERDERLGYVAHVIGHAVETSKDLTKSEASKVIEALTVDAERASA